MSDFLIFANPIAGRGHGRTIAERIAARIQRQGMTAQTFFDPPANLRDDRLSGDRPPRAVVSIGGDGTLRSVVERMVQFFKADPAQIPPTLVVPLGTANLMASHLGIAWERQTLQDQVVAAVLQRNLTMLDAATANGRLFLLMAGVGIDAAIVHELDRLRKGPIDLTSYALPAVLAMQDYQFPPLRVIVDGKQVLDHQPAMALVGNVPEYGTGFPILTQARSDDGLLDLCVLPCQNRMQVISLLMAVMTGDHLREEGVIYERGRTVRIESSTPVPVQIDGEASGHTPLNIELLPFKVPFIVP